MKVVLATDGSQHAEEAAWFLARLPHRDLLELTVVFVSNVPRLHDSMIADDLVKQLETADREKAIATFEHVKTIFAGANVALELVVGQGHVGTTIVSESEAHKSQLIVLGAVGHSFFDRLFGSTSDFVATHARCSVLVVRPTGLKTGKRPLGLCIAYDVSDPEPVVAEQLAQFGWGKDTKLEVVNIITNPLAYSEIPYTIDLDAIKADRKRVVDVAALSFRQLSPHVATHVVDGNHVGDGLIQFAKEKKSDMIVMGHTGGGLLRDFLLGSVSKYVLRNAACSVWIVR